MLANRLACLPSARLAQKVFLETPPAGGRNGKPAVSFEADEPSTACTPADTPVAGNSATSATWLAKVLMKPDLSWCTACAASLCGYDSGAA